MDIYNTIFDKVLDYLKEYRTKSITAKYAIYGNIVSYRRSVCEVTFSKDTPSSIEQSTLAFADIIQSITDATSQLNPVDDEIAEHITAYAYLVCITYGGSL